jgi:autoaggregation protein RapA/B/C
MSMANSRPVAGDISFRSFEAGRPVEGYLLDNSYDPDGDVVRVNFVNGQRITPPKNVDTFGGTTIEGKYGSFLVNTYGSFVYKFDPAKLAGVEPGQQVTESLTFKISDGKGATDFGITKITLDVPETGSYLIDFENAPVSNGDIQDGYAGFYWGNTSDDSGWRIATEADGNHYATTNPFSQRFERVDGRDFQVESLKIADASDDPSVTDAIVTFYGLDENEQIISSKEVYIYADSLSEGQTISLTELGFVDGIRMQVRYTNPDYGSFDVLAIDDIAVNVETGLFV